MRLIEADALLGVIAEQERWNVPDFVYESIKNAPTIDAEPIRHGHWIKVGYSYFGVSRYECSVCHYTDEHNESREVPYCWQCGARMENDDNM